MMNRNLKTFPYTQTQTSIFENIFKLENLLMNHAVIEPGQVFPKHPTDADVYALIVKGVLSVALEDEMPRTFEEGQVIHIPKGLISELGNRGGQTVEIFVLKINL